MRRISCSTAGAAAAGPEGAPGSSRGAKEFLEEALALWGQRQKVRLVRADSGLFDDQPLSLLEERSLLYIVVARLTTWVKRQAQHVERWAALDASFSVGEFRLRLLPGQIARRFIVVRERLREKRDGPGRKLIDVPGYTFRIFVINRSDAPELIWRDYNRRADMDNPGQLPVWQTERQEPVPAAGTDQMRPLRPDLRRHRRQPA